MRGNKAKVQVCRTSSLIQKSHTIKKQARERLFFTGGNHRMNGKWYTQSGKGRVNEVGLKYTGKGDAGKTS